MEFWELESNALHECCLYRYQAFLDDEETRRQFLRKTLLPRQPTVFPETFLGYESRIKRYRSRLWKIMDNGEESMAAKVYFVCVLLMVLLSIFVLAYSTVPSMRRPVSKCELLEYMESIGHEYVNQVRERLGSPACSNTGSWISSGDWEYEDFSVDTYDWYYFEYSWGQVWDEFEDIANDLSEILNDQVEGVTPEAASNYSTTHAPTTTGNGNSTNGPRNIKAAGALMRDSAADYLADYFNWQPEQPARRKFNVPQLTVPKLPFDILDIILTMFFTIDLILRLASCPSLRRYFLSIINIFDALALLATYIYLIIITVEKQYRYKESDWLNLLDFAQVFRALRLFRVVKNVRASKVLAYSLTQNVRDMTLLVTLLFVGISTFACLFYFAESRDTIDSIPNAWYWAIVTMTTVGYGDISPKTATGRVISSICAICGVLLLAITLPMFVNNFLTLYQYSCVTESIEKGKREKDPDVVICDDRLSKQKDRMEVEDMVDEPPAYESPTKSMDKGSEKFGHKITVCNVKEAFVS